MPLADNLRALRGKADLSQRELGQACDPPLAQEIVSAYERGLRPPRGSDHVTRLARALRVAPDVLTGPSLINVPQDAAAS